MSFKKPKPNVGRFSPTESTAPPPDKLHPAISLRYLRNSHCISRCTQEDRAAFADRIRTMTQMTWTQIHQAHRHGAGIEKIDQLQNELPPAAPKGSHAMALRFSGMKPMVGFRVENVFYVVWFDRDMNLYNHG